MTIQIEPTNMRCEFGHMVMKFQIVGHVSHRLLCPRCYYKEIEELEKEAKEEQQDA